MINSGCAPIQVCVLFPCQYAHFRAVRMQRINAYLNVMFKWMWFLLLLPLAVGAVAVAIAATGANW